MRFIVLQGPGLPGTLPLHGLHCQGLLQERGDDQAFQGTTHNFLMIIKKSKRHAKGDHDYKVEKSKLRAKDDHMLFTFRHATNSSSPQTKDCQIACLQ